MSKTSIHVNPDYEAEVIQLLEDKGFDVTVGSSPMVDWVVDRSDDTTSQKTHDE